MKYSLLTHCGLALKLSKEQAIKAIKYGESLYYVDIESDIKDNTKSTSYLVIDIDSSTWLYEVLIID